MIPGLLPGTTYAITVHAEYSAGSGPPSASVMTTLPGKAQTLAFCSARVLATDADGATSVDSADFDRDGDLDVVAASSTDDVIAWQDTRGGFVLGPHAPYPHQRLCSRGTGRHKGVPYWGSALCGVSGYSPRNIVHPARCPSSTRCA